MAVTSLLFIPPSWHLLNISNNEDEALAEHKAQVGRRIHHPDCLLDSLRRPYAHAWFRLAGTLVSHWRFAICREELPIDSKRVPSS